jgi:predicted TIM-barrel fold metal-dependent hydrolase
MFPCRRFTKPGLVAALLVCSGILGPSIAQRARQPIIDVHLHSDWYDPGGADNPRNPRAKDAEELRRRTLAALGRYNVVVAVTDGSETEQWAAAAPGRILPAWGFGDPSDSIESVRQWFSSGRYRVMAESAPQYSGQSPADPALEPYFALAEELDVPVGILCLLKSSFLLRPLMLRLPIDTLLGDHVGAPVPPVDPANMGAFTRCASTRNPGAATPTAGTAARPAAAASARTGGSLALGHARALLDRMANSAPDRQA